MNDHVQYCIEDRVATISLVRPPVNALSLDVIRAIVVALKRAAADPQVRAVIISSGVAKRFSAGLDIDILLGKSSDEIRPFVHELYINLFEAQFRLGKPSIAAVGGAARGGGMTVAVSCDVVVASDSASFGYPEIDLGLLPAIHFAHLPRLAGRHRAFELLFSGRAFGPTEAAELGLVTKVVADAELDDTVRRMALEFASKSEKVVRLGRAAFMRQIDIEYRRSVEYAVEDFCAVAASEEAQEGLRAFVEKREPAWRPQG